MLMNKVDAVAQIDRVLTDCVTRVCLAVYPLNSKIYLFLGSTGLSVNPDRYGI